MQSANLQVIKAIGRTDVYLKLEIVKKVVGILLLLVSMPFGVHMIAAGAVASNVFAVLINTVANKKLLDYGLWQQLKDLLNGIFPLAIMGGAVFAAGLLSLPSLALLGVQIVVGAVVYVLASWVLKNESFGYLLNFAKQFLKRKKK